MDFKKIESKELGETLYLGTHESGLGVFVIPKKGFSKKYAIFGTRYGSIDNNFIPIGEKEPIKVPDGIAHFLEHKMFEQSDGSNAFDLFSKYGANANAFTSFTSTCYLFSCTDNFNENFEHLLNYVQDPYFTDENVSKEQGIIGQEIRMYDDDPDWQSMQGVLRSLYKNNPVRIDIAGTTDSISKINKDVLYKCYNTFYNPANMALCVAGDVDVDDVLSIVNRAVRCDRQSAPVTSVYPDEPKEINRKYFEKKLSVSIPMFNIGFKDTKLKSGDELLKNEIASNMILKILAGRSSKLFTDMYSSGLINGTFGSETMMEPQFSCVMIAGESKDPQKVQEKIMAFIDEKRKNCISKEEFERSKKAYLGRFMRNFNDVEDLASMFLRNVLNGINMFNFYAVYDKIDADFINRRLNEVFREENMAMSVINPI